MKTMVRCIACFAVAMLMSAGGNSALGQQFNTVSDDVFGPTANGGSFGQGTTPLSADIFNWMPGRFWVGFTGADRALGYSGSYATFGFKNRIGEDILDGRWLFEGRAHLSVESGNPFVNLGIMRNFTLNSAGADISTGFWFDWDGDEQGAFAHTFRSIGANLTIKTRRFVHSTNLYGPTGGQSFTLGGPVDTPNGAFFGNLITLQSGVDSALNGVDTTLRYRPDRLGFVNGTVEIGGYSYESDIIDQFAGIRVGLGVQPLRGAIFNFQMTHDDRFKTTGIVQMTYLMGVNARGTQYSYLGTDLDPTIRNDHIVRYQRDFRAVIDPDTGLPYNVIHVNNTVAPGAGAGTFESPFGTLAEAEAASMTDDIIFVDEGDGTSTGYTTGIVLKDRQFLLGDGVEHLIPTIGGLFRLPNNVDNILPTISGAPHAVTLANDNVVRGFNINNDNGGMIHGIGHTGGVGSTIDNGTIEDINVTGAAQDGIHLDGITGDWVFQRINSVFNGRDGIHIINACDPASTFLFDTITASNNLRDGIHIENYDGTTFTFGANIFANGNGDDGIELIGFKNGAGVGGNLTFMSPSMTGNIGFAISVNDFDGNATFLDSQITQNIGGGIQLINVRNTAAGTMTFIGTSSAITTSNFLSNGIGGGAAIDVLLNDPGAVQRLTITNSTIGGVHDGNLIITPGGLGIRAVADGIGTTLTTDIVDNLAISYNNSEGIRLISTGGATHTARILNNITPLVMDGNGLAGAGDNIELIVGDDNGGVLAVLDVLMQNITTNATLDLAGNVIAPGTSGAWLRGTSSDDGVLRAVMQNVTGDTITGSVVVLNFNNDGNGALGDRVNMFTMNNNTFTNLASNGVVATTGPDTFSDISITNNNFAVTPTIVGNVGIAVTANATDGGIIDNRTRLNIQNNIIGTAAGPFDFGGIAVTANNDTHMLMNIEGNTIRNAGAGGAATNVLPFFDGIAVTANDAARIDARFVNNLVTASADIGLQVNHFSTGQMNLFLDGNALTGNDFGEDPANDPIIDANNIQIGIQNLGGGQICLAMTNNFYGGAGTVLVNGGVAADFELELDGLTNSLPITQVGPFTVNPFGTNCEPDITTQEGVFVANGFPPR